MKNNLKLKSLLIKIIFLSIVVISVNLIIKNIEYKSYNKEYNNKINSIINYVLKEYNVNEEDLIKIINSDDSDKTEILKKYGIDINKDSIVLKNEDNYNKYVIISVIFIIIEFIILFLIIKKHENKNKKEINEIINYIEQINKKNYELSMDTISEDQLSILKNEIYKITIMLKETTSKAIEDKKELKLSLENISHQIKTPLTSILIILNNLIDDPNMDSEIRNDFISDIKREIVNINFLVQSLLKLSKIDSNTVVFNKEEVKLNDIVKEAINNVSIISDIKNLTINYNEVKNIKIKCDFKWEIEAITNILKNCCEHSFENNKIDILIKENNMYSSIEIRDYGEGISKEDIKHLFERFYRSKNSKQDSIGIGLSLANSIIKKDNGNISVTSDKTGTLFKIKYFKI